ncbi:MAG: holo-ACP synthase [Fidelibacterota bacterium]
MISNYSIGTDLVDVGRVRKLSEDHGERFLRRLFTGEEIGWCSRRAQPYIHLAGKFAAKEAVRKALMALGESDSIPFNRIEIVREGGRHPTVRIHRTLPRSYNVEVSISHTDRLATAVALAHPT